MQLTEDLLRAVFSKARTAAACSHPVWWCQAGPYTAWSISRSQASNNQLASSAFPCWLLHAATAGKALLTMPCMLQVLQVSLPASFPRMTYAEAVAKYGTDKPDLRYDLQLHDITQAVKDSEFRWAVPVGCSCGTPSDRRGCQPLE